MVSDKDLNQRLDEQLEAHRKTLNDANLYEDQGFLWFDQDLPSGADSETGISAEQAKTLGLDFHETQRRYLDDVLIKGDHGDAVGAQFQGSSIMDQARFWSKVATEMGDHESAEIWNGFAQGPGNFSAPITENQSNANISSYWNKEKIEYVQAFVGFAQSEGQQQLMAAAMSRGSTMTPQLITSRASKPFKIEKPPGGIDTIRSSMERKFEDLGKLGQRIDSFIAFNSGAAAYRQMEQNAPAIKKLITDTMPDFAASNAAALDNVQSPEFASALLSLASLPKEGTSEANAINFEGTAGVTLLSALESVKDFATEEQKISLRDANILSLKSYINESLISKNNGEDGLPIVGAPLALNTNPSDPAFINASKAINIYLKDAPADNWHTKNLNKLFGRLDSATQNTINNPPAPQEPETKNKTGNDEANTSESSKQSQSSDNTTQDTELNGSVPVLNFSSSATKTDPLGDSYTKTIINLQNARGVETTGEYADVKSYISTYLQTALHNYLATNNQEVTAQNGIKYRVDAASGDIFEFDKDKKSYKEQAVSNIANAGERDDDDVPHIVMLSVLEQGLAQDETLNDYAQKKLRSYEAAQIEALNKAIPESIGSEADYLQEAKSATNKDDLRKRLGNSKFRQGLDDDGLTELTTIIWGMEASRRGYEQNPTYDEVVTDAGAHKGFHIKAAIHDLVSYNVTGIMPNTLGKLQTPKPESKLVYDDRMFDPRVYIQLDKQKGIDGGLVGHPGKTVTREYIATLAIEKMISKAAELGIPQDKITEKMFSGDFNPYFEDFELAYESLATFDDLTVDDIPVNFRNYMVQQGDMKEIIDANGNKTYTMPDDINLHGVLAAKRNEAWNAKFGSLKDSGFKVSTSVNGQDVTLTGEDLALRQLRRLRGQRFESAYGDLFEMDEKTTYADAKAALKDRPDLLDALNEEINGVMERQSAFSHFNLHVLSSDKQFDLKNDYQNLRKGYVNDLALAKEKELSSAEKSRAAFKDNEVTGGSKEKTPAAPKTTIENNVSPPSGN